MKDQKNINVAYNKYFSDFRLPRYREVPDVGLLLEQTARLINGYLKPFSGIRLTNSMISNYVKQEIIPRPVKKLYYRDQICALIFIALSKTVLSLDDVKKFLDIMYGSYSADVSYNFFCDTFEDYLRHGFSGDIRQDLEESEDIPGAAKQNTVPEDTPEAAPAASGPENSESVSYLLKLLVVTIINSIHLRFCLS